MIALISPYEQIDSMHSRSSKYYNTFLTFVQQSCVSLVKKLNDIVFCLTYLEGIQVTAPSQGISGMFVSLFCACCVFFFCSLCVIMLYIFLSSSVVV